MAFRSSLAFRSTLRTLAVVYTLALWAALVVPAFTGVWASEGAAGQVRLRVTGPSVDVFDSERDGCAPDDVPDLPLRAVRLDDGRIIAIASEWHNRLFKGRSLTTLKRDCRIVYQGADDEAPEQFDDRSWISSLWTKDGRAIYALIHNEYQAHRHPTRCPIGKYYQCWYNTIVFARSTDGGESFHRPAGAAALVAAPPFQQDVGQGKQRGFMRPSNIVERDGFLYTYAFTPGYQSQRPGSCLLRTADISDPASWRAWDGKAFSIKLADPYQPDSGTDTELPCKPIAPFPRALDAVVRVGSSDLWIAVYTAAAATRKISEPGVYYSVSRDLISWSDPVLLLALPMRLGDACLMEPPYLYASLLDPNAKSRSFEDVESDAYLFMTRSDVAHCHQTMHRSLVRWPIKIERDTPAPTGK